MPLIIVESPTKAKTLAKFLPKEYKIVSSYGHVRDLPKSKLGIDVEKNFEPQYLIPTKAKKTIKELKSLAEKTDLILLATDPDREGEAIAWHLNHILESGKKETKRITFHEITKEAILSSLDNPGEINLSLVNAQQARRVLDRLVGYKLSPLLWKKVIMGLSAGRVQSVALKFVVEREKEIKSFQEKEYWTIEAELEKKEKFLAQLVKIKGKTLTKFSLENKEEAQKTKESLEKQEYFVLGLETKEVKKNPLPPLITSTLQQEAYKRLRFSSKMTMRVAQQLYEKGFITYHRTDSLNLSQSSIKQAQQLIVKNYGQEYWKGTFFKSKKKNIQEAHEAIRPTNPNETPEKIKLDKNQSSLYSLIWKRFIASQMSPAILTRITAEIETKPDDFLLRASGQTIKFDGFLKVYHIKMEEKTIPFLELKENLKLIQIISQQHFTQPPPRYTEATLIKALEEKGIGRPSTYAPIISVIQERNYVVKNEEKRFQPTDIGTIVSDLLTEHFPQIIDDDFTAEIERNLDQIAEGKLDWTKVVKDFYLPFEKTLKEKEKELDKKKITEKETDEICEKCGSAMVSKIGKFGRFLACSKYPECRNTKELEEKKSEEPCEKCGSAMILKRSRFGTFWGCSNYPQCRNIRKDEKDTGLICPDCKQGKVVVRKSKRNRNFYGCSRYPECKFISSKKPK
jgi:DNA topoisomerase I